MSKRFVFVLVSIMLALVGVFVLLNPLFAQTARAASLERAPLNPAQNTLTVCPGGPPDCDHASIQDAVDAASDGDTIKVATGIYTDRNYLGGGWNVVFVNKTVAIRGGYVISDWQTSDPDTHPTIIDGEGKARGILVGRIGYRDNITPTLENLVVQNGSPQVEPGGGGVYINRASAVISGCAIISNTNPGIDDMSGNGGGVEAYYATITLTGNTISGNTAERGAGLYLRGSNAGLIADNIVSGNIASGIGGGVYANTWSGEIADNTISGNEAREGGGLFVAWSENVTLTSNTISDNSVRQEGGGIFLFESPITLTGNVIANNDSGHGGGAYALNSDTALSNNIIANNTAEWLGGGLFSFNSNATLDGNTISSNWAVNGGGLWIEESLQVELVGNFVHGNRSAIGGGLYLDESVVTLSSNTIADNSCPGGHGGGIALYASDATLTGNIVKGNTVQHWGGGFYLMGTSTAALVNNVIANNAAGNGGGMYLENSLARLLHTTIARNEGDGIHVDDGSIALTNTILVDHAVGISVTAGTATLEGTLWHNNATDWGGAGAIVTGTHNVWGDPLFDGDGYHLMDGSVAVDAGVDAGVTTDIDGEGRPMGLGPDIGADEHPEPIVASFEWESEVPYMVVFTNTSTGPITTWLWNFGDGVTTTERHPTHIYSTWGYRYVTLVVDGPGGSDSYSELVTIMPPQPAVSLMVTAEPTPTVRSGAQLTYTIYVINTGNVDLHATVTDTLPFSVTLDPVGTALLPGGMIVWTSTISVDGVWTETVVVTVDSNYKGLLTNVVKVSTVEGVTTTAVVTSTVVLPPEPEIYLFYMPLVLRNCGDTPVVIGPVPTVAPPDRR